MQLVFTKGADKNDRLDIHRDDGAVETIQCPKQRIIPHDMVHYAVEHTLVKRGFLGRVKDGERAMFTMLPEAESDAVERLVEVFQGDGWSGGGSAAADMIDLYRVTCDARGCPMLPVTAADIDAVRERIAELDTAWQGVPVGGVLTLAF
ncbi:MAG: hypothetical protein JNM76_18195 [Betaproteobacteria bacterium]|nr:hypothetical protein [Betaproteobacteria bacterium]